MIRLVFGAACAVLLVSAVNADPLAEAHAGKVQCYRPDTARKVCGGLSSYVFENDGSITNKADILLAAQPVVRLQIASPAVVKGDAVCGPMRKEDLDRATILIDGTPLPEDKAAEAKVQILAAFKDQMGQESCTTYVPDGDKLSAKVTLNGVAKPEYTQTVIWVKPEDGYTVAP